MCSQGLTIPALIDRARPGHPHVGHPQGRVVGADRRRRRRGRGRLLRRCRDAPKVRRACRTPAPRAAISVLAQPPSSLPSSSRWSSSPRPSWPGPSWPRWPSSRGGLLRRGLGRSLLRAVPSWPEPSSAAAFAGAAAFFAAAAAFLAGALASFLAPLVIALNSAPARNAGTLVFLTLHRSHRSRGCARCGRRGRASRRRRSR